MSVSLFLFCNRVYFFCNAFCEYHITTFLSSDNTCEYVTSVYFNFLRYIYSKSCSDASNRDPNLVNYCIHSTGHQIMFIMTRYFYIISMLGEYSNNIIKCYIISLPIWSKCYQLPTIIH